MNAKKALLIVIFLCIGSPLLTMANVDVARKISPIIFLLLGDTELTIDISILETSDGQALKGGEYLARIEFAEKSSGSYHYAIETPGVEAEVDENGALRYRPDPDAPTGVSIIVVRVTDLTTGGSVLVEIPVEILETEVIASKTVGAEGGLVADEWEDTVLEIPEGSLEQNHEINILRGVSSEGSYLYEIATEAEFDEPIAFRAPRLPADTQENLAEGINKSSKTELPTEGLFTESLWKNFPADYLELRRLFINNAENRIPADSDLNAYHHPKIRIEKRSNASSLYSFCGLREEYLSMCSGRDPVLFVHGFSPNGEDDSFSFGIGGQGGGEDTWGQFRELLQLQGYAVFEFRWRTNTTFFDGADDLGSAINMIATTTGKKVHLVAHSFGGLLSRAYLQNYARNFAYADDVASLVTLGTPHSGIFDEVSLIEDREYPAGQDSDLGYFEFCNQASCYEAGEPTDSAFNLIDRGKVFSIKGLVGMSDVPGRFIDLIQRADPGHKIEANTKVLIGLTNFITPLDALTSSGPPRVDCDNRDQWDSSPDRYAGGDALISFSGQRYLSFSRNTPIDRFQDLDPDPSITVEESVLGVPIEFMEQAIPGNPVPEGLAFHESESGECQRLDFEGYRHTGAPLAVGSVRGTLGEPFVTGIEEPRPGEGHAALSEVVSWLADQSPSPAYTGARFNLSIKVESILDGTPIEGGSIRVFVGTLLEGDGTTDSSGAADLSTTFVREAPYTISVSAPGFHTEEINIGYQSNLDPVNLDLGTVRLHPDDPVVGEVVGTVRDASTGEPILGADVTLQRHRIIRQSRNTDASGGFNFQDMTAGFYRAIVSKPGYKDYQIQTLEVVASNPSTFNIGLEQAGVVRLNDTGVTVGVNYPTGSNPDCSGIQIEQQDCSHGRDAFAPRNDDGVAGFNYTKLDDDGRELPSFATTWSCVKDNTTGLIWENKTMDGSVSDRNNRITWQALGSKRVEINTIARCGFNDWRVPSPQEMLSIVQYGKNPTIDQNYFPYVTPENIANSQFWVNLNVHPAFQYYIEFGLGELHDAQINFLPIFSYRFVRSDAPLESQLVDNNDGTVTDTTLGLMWQKCLSGLSGDDCELGTPGAFNLSSALSHADTVNASASTYTDWRVPNVKEAYSQVYNLHVDASAASFFPNGSSSIMTSTYSPRRGVQSNALDQVYIPAGAGNIQSRERDQDTRRLRLVRSIK